MDKLLQIAVKELGQKEISGPEDNPAIVNYAKEAGFEWVDDDETPWCSIFLNWCALNSGLLGTNKVNARSWLLSGKSTENPEPGDVVVFWRESPDSWKGHVGLFFGFSKDASRVYVLGGNQGNQVSLSAFPTDTVLGYRRLVHSEALSLPDPILRKGNHGDKVKQLQEVLKQLGFDCGTADGNFGGMTERALKNFQATGQGQKIDGVFGRKTRDYMLSVMNE